MKNAFDMYAKVAPDLVTASARGGVFSLIAVVLMAFMFITETYVFLGAGPVREVIDLEMDVSAELRMNVNLDFPNLECSDLTVELWRASVRSQPRSMEKTLQVSQFNPISKRKRRYERIVNAKKGAEGGFTGCKVEGYVNGYNSPGSLKISAPPNANLSHTVNAFSFGPPQTRDQAKHLARLPEKFRKVADGTLDGRDFFHHANDKVFHHFIHVVPTKYALAGVRKHLRPCARGRVRMDARRRWRPRRRLGRVHLDAARGPVRRRGGASSRQQPRQGTGRAVWRIDLARTRAVRARSASRGGGTPRAARADLDARRGPLAARRPRAARADLDARRGPLAL